MIYNFVLDELKPALTDTCVISAKTELATATVTSAEAAAIAANVVQANAVPDCLLKMRPMNANPISIIAQLAGSGTGAGVGNGEGGTI